MGVITMSKIGNAVFEGQEFAQNNYSDSWTDFKAKVSKAFGVGFIADVAIEEWQTIQNDLSENY